MTARADPAPPPPPFEEAPERPLFAPDPPEGRAARVPRSPAPDTHGGTGTGAGYWPWGQDSGTLPPAPPEEDEETDDGRVPGRSSLRIAALIALAAVVLLAMVYAFNRGRESGGSDDASPQQSGSAAPTTSAPTTQPFRIAGVQDFDPYGDPAEENPELAPLAIDGKPDTAWVSNRYDQQFGPGGLKPGVGLLVDLGQARDVGSVDVTLQGSPSTVELLGSTDEAPPTGVDGLDRLATGEATGTEVTLTPKEPTSARWLVVWLTRAPDVGGGFRGAVSEIVVNP
jgi:hypothetical protein